jgi:hypothetical protein
MTMTKRNMIRVALLNSVTPVAFENDGPGWKKKADGSLELDANGNPIYVDANGREQPVQGDTISRLNKEARDHRTAKEAAESNLEKFKKDGKLIDPETAFKAIDTVANLDAKKLIDAGEVENVKAAIRTEYETKLSEKDKAINERDATIDSMTIDRLFDSSEFVRNGIAIPQDMFRDSMSKHFKKDANGKLIAHDRDGNPLMSKENPGDYASGDEAFKLLVDRHPQKDAILKAENAGGSGNNGNGGQRGSTGKTIKRAEFDAMDPSAKATAGIAMGKGELTVVD